jgi:hypothetical protein
MIIKAKIDFAMAFFIDVREIVGSSPTMTIIYSSFLGFPLSLVIFRLFSLLVIPVLPSSKSSSDKRSAFRGSLDCRLKADNDEKKNKHGNDRWLAGIMLGNDKIKK